MTLKHTIFVYGTLKSGQPNHHWLQNSENGCQQMLPGKFQTVQKFPMIIDTPWNIPFLLDVDFKTDPKDISNTNPKTSDFRHSIKHSVSIGKHFSSIKGEIYKVDDLMLSKLDILEVYPEFYSRKVISCENDEDPDLVEAQVYLLENVDFRKVQGKKLINNFDAEFIGYIKPEERPQNHREVSLAVIKKLKNK